MWSSTNKVSLQAAPLLSAQKPDGMQAEETTSQDIGESSAQRPGLGYPQTTALVPISSPSRSADQRREFKGRNDRASRLWMQVALSCGIMFAEGFYVTHIFPYVSFMTEELRGNTVALGVYTGLLYTSQSAGMLITASCWARASNRYGRRKCLLAGLSLACLATVIQAFSADYWLVSGIRFFSGLLNNNLSIVRTALRESYQREKAEDTSAFSMLSVAFGASCVAGPSLGGLVYGLFPTGALGGMCHAWTPPLLICAALYACNLVLSIKWLPETADLSALQGSAPTSADATKGNYIPLLRQARFRYLLFMAGGHAYCFTGWELVYPLLARMSPERGGEGWDTRHIGLTFLVGSAGLMLWSLAIYPRIAKRVSLAKLWLVLWMLPVTLVPLFARALPLALESGFDAHGPLVLLLNYGTQLFVSVCIGCQFISIQLLINQYVSKLPDGASFLAMANGYLVSTQAFARALAPLTSGYLFNLGAHAHAYGLIFTTHSVAFDHLSLTALLFCVFCAAMYDASPDL